MITLNDIQEKKQAGQLKEALKLATTAYEKQPEDPDTRKAISEVYMELMKEAVEKQELETAKSYFKAYSALELPDDETSETQEHIKSFYRRCFPEYARMQEANKLSKSGKHEEALAIYEEVLETLEDYSVAFVNVGWCLYRLLAEMAPKPSPDLALINKCISTYRRFDIHGPSNLHSQMLRILLYFKEHLSIELWDFIHWWNFDNFREEDLTPFTAGGGNTIPSLRERAYLTYAKLLLEGLKTTDAETLPKIQKYCAEFLPLLDASLPELPRNVWLPYARTRLLIQLGKRREMEKELLYYIKQKTNEFWAWAALAEVYVDTDDGQALACYCKSLLLPAQGELAIFVRECLTSLLIKHQLYNEAKGEIDIIVLNRSKKKWHQSDLITEWRKHSWYRTAKAPLSNKTFYLRNAPKADILLWSDIPDSIAVVTHVDKIKNAFYFAVNKRIGGKHMLKANMRIRVGDILALKLREMETGGNIWYKVASMRSEKELLPEEITQYVDEIIQIPRGRDFGFLKPSNIYVGPDVVKNYRLFDGQRVAGIALLSFNKAKNEWTWKLLNVEEQ